MGSRYRNYPKVQVKYTDPVKRACKILKLTQDEIVKAPQRVKNIEEAITRMESWRNKVASIAERYSSVTQAHQQAVSATVKILQDRISQLNMIAETNRLKLGEFGFISSFGRDYKTTQETWWKAHYAAKDLEVELHTLHKEKVILDMETQEFLNLNISWVNEKQQKQFFQHLPPIEWEKKYDQLLQEQLSALDTALDMIAHPEKFLAQAKKYLAEAKAAMTPEHSVEHQRLKAIASAADKKAREDMGKLRSLLFEAQKIGTLCPYCGKALIELDSHADHIIPIHYGGLSISGNLVLVCRACNLSKGKMTLREFCEKFSLDRHLIENRLLALEKRV